MAEDMIGTLFESDATSLLDSEASHLLTELESMATDPGQPPPIQQPQMPQQPTPQQNPYFDYGAAGVAQPMRSPVSQAMQSPAGSMHSPGAMMSPSTPQHFSSPPPQQNNALQRQMSAPQQYQSYPSHSMQQGSSPQGGVPGTPPMWRSAGPQPGYPSGAGGAPPHSPQQGYPMSQHPHMAPPGQHKFNGEEFEGKTLQAIGFNFLHQKITQHLEILNRCLERYGTTSCILIKEYPDEFKYPYPLIAEMITIGCYAVYVEEILKVIPRDMIYINMLEEYSVNPRNAMSEIYRFTGTRADGGNDPQISSAGNRVKNQGIGVKPVMKESIDVLNSFYKPCNAHLAELLGDSKWLYE